MDRKEPDFQDNVFVARNKWGGNEYLSLFVKYEQDQWDKEETYLPIHISRYCVPGRCDTYSFSWWDRPQGWGDCVTYFSESHTPLPKILEMIKKDLDKPQVVELLKEAAEKLILYKANNLLFFIRQLAPSSKSVKALIRIVKRKQDIAKANVQKIREEREKTCLPLI